MSSDTGIKLFGKTIAIPFCSEEDGEDYDKCSPRDKEQLSEEPRSAEENQDDHNDRQEKTALKKPDKILACPRCRSMDTKFCYYNNYNINQPRHFCKNCQRYWTAGGTMRNVPVGAGRRRSKNSANSQFQQLIISDTTLKANDGSSNNSGSRVLSFGCDALPAAANEHKTATATSNPIDDSSGANFQWAPWPYPWAPPPTPIIWGYGTPWISPIVMTTSSSSAPASGHLSPLGKHSRERNGVSKEYEGDSGRKGNIWIPKTLRIDDPEEAAKSSIWAAMGFDNEKSDKCLFKPFPKKSVELKANSNSQLLNVNPASLSRSFVCFTCHNGAVCLRFEFCAAFLVEWIKPAIILLYLLQVMNRTINANELILFPLFLYCCRSYANANRAASSSLHQKFK